MASSPAAPTANRPYSYGLPFRYGHLDEMVREKQLRSKRLLEEKKNAALSTQEAALYEKLHVRLRCNRLANGLSRGVVALSFRDSKRRTLLHIAAMAGSVTGATYCIDRGVDMNAKDGRGWTALRHAVANRDFKVVSALLGRGCDADIPDTVGTTPLHQAAHCGDGALCELLMVSGGADHRARDAAGRDTLQLLGSVQMERTILERQGRRKFWITCGLRSLHDNARAFISKRGLWTPDGKLVKPKDGLVRLTQSERRIKAAAAAVAAAEAEDVDEAAGEDATGEGSPMALDADAMFDPLVNVIRRSLCERFNACSWVGGTARQYMLDMESRGYQMTDPNALDLSKFKVAKEETGEAEDSLQAARGGGRSGGGKAGNEGGE